MTWFTEKSNLMTGGATPALFGDNIVANSSFDDTTSWTYIGWTIAGGKATHNTPNTSILSQTIPAAINTTYLLEFKCSGRSTGSAQISFGGRIINLDISNKEQGLMVESANNVAGSELLQIIPTTDFNGAIEYITMKPMIGTPVIGETNFLLNPGFEDNNTTGWFASNTTFASSTVLKRTGSYSGLLTTLTTSTPHARYNISALGLTIGKHYRFSSWGYAPSTNLGLNDGTISVDSNTNHIVYMYSLLGTPENQWNYAEYYFTYLVANTYLIITTRRPTNALATGDKVYFDDMKLEELIY